MIQSDIALIGSPKVREYILTIHRDGSRTLSQRTSIPVNHRKGNQKSVMSMVARSVVKGVISRRYEMQCMFKLAIILTLSILTFGAIKGTSSKTNRIIDVGNLAVSTWSNHIQEASGAIGNDALMKIISHIIYPNEAIVATEDISTLSTTVEPPLDIISMDLPISSSQAINQEEDRLIKNGISQPNVIAQTLELTQSSPVVASPKVAMVEYDLPSKYYAGVDFSSFQAYMCYSTITNRNSPAYKVVRSKNAYTDEYGFRRYATTSDQFTIDGKDDYVIALGTYYKEKGTCGERYLIETTTGAYTAIAGDEKADAHTDSLNMISSHGDGQYAGMIEWILDINSGKVPRSIRQSGTVTEGPIEELKGEIISISRIE